ncbi:hypothetical protein D043_4291A, partial [Vibrio parahaemolyticus EKP-021]
MCALGWLHES